MAWENQIYVDGALPFGLRSALKIFNAVAEALLWGWKVKGAQFAWHYLDDFITTRRPGSGECNFNCELLHHLCNKLGIRLAEEKSEGPATSITFLGIEIDSLAMEMCLPKEKLHRVQEELMLWQAKRCTKQELQSLTGRLYDLLTGTTCILTLPPAPIWHGFWPVGMEYPSCTHNGAQSLSIQWSQTPQVTGVVAPTAIGDGLTSVCPAPAYRRNQ